MSTVVVRSIADSSRPTAAQCSRRIASRSVSLASSPIDVPLVGVPGDGPQRLRLPRPADHDRQPDLDRRRRADGLAHRVDRAVVRDRLPVEQAADEHHGLVEAVEALAEPAAEVDPEPLVLALEPRAAEAEDRAAARQVVERRRELGGQARVAERVRGDHQPEGGSLGDLRPAGERGPALEDRSLRRPDDRVQVVPGPEARGARPVGEGGGVAQLGPARGLRPEQEADLDRGHDQSSRCSWTPVIRTRNVTRGCVRNPAIDRSVGPSGW